MAAPAIGTFIRPVGRMYCYCYEVVKVLERDDCDAEQWWCKRWGMSDDNQPVNDGHHGISYLNGLTEVLPGVWKDEWEFETPRWACCPIYYKKIDLKGQQDLFI